MFPPIFFTNLRQWQLETTGPGIETRVFFLMKDDDRFNNKAVDKKTSKPRDAKIHQALLIHQ